MNLIEQFQRHIYALGYAPGTIEGYRSLLRDFQRFLNETDSGEIHRCRESDIINYLEFSRKRRSGLVIFNTVCRLKHFYRHLVEQDLIFYSPIEAYRVPKLRSISRSVRTADQMRRLLDSIRTDTSLQTRTKAILELAYSSALRSCEIRRLRIEHIDSAEGLLFIERSKNRKDRYVPAGRSAIEAVDRYIRDVRPRFVKPHSHSYVFVSHRGGNPLSASGFWRGIAATFEASGVASIPPHSIRASSATALLKAGMHVGFIAELLGHTELSTTQCYLRMNERALNDEIRQNHPRAYMKIEGEDHDEL